MGWGTGSSPTRVPLLINFKISFSSEICLSRQIFSTCGTRTCNSLMMVCSGRRFFQADAQCEVASHCGASDTSQSTKNALFYQCWWKIDFTTVTRRRDGINKNLLTLCLLCAVQYLFRHFHHLRDWAVKFVNASSSRGCINYLWCSIWIFWPSLAWPSFSACSGASILPSAGCSLSLTFKSQFEMASAMSDSKVTFLCVSSSAASSMFPSSAFWRCSLAICFSFSCRFFVSLRPHKFTS